MLLKKFVASTVNSTSGSSSVGSGLTLTRGETFRTQAELEVPGQPGTMWIVATVAVPDESPWQAAEIAQCEVVPSEGP